MVKIRSGFAAFFTIMILACDLKTAILSLLAALLHETGHLLTLRAFHVEIESIRGVFGGFIIEYEGLTLSYGREAICAVSGPLMGLFCAASASLLGRMTGAESAYIFSGISFLYFFINSLPVSVLDGGRTLFCILCLFKEEDTARRVSLFFDTVTVLFLSLLGIFVTITGESGLLPCASAILLIRACCKKSRGSVIF